MIKYIDFDLQVLLDLLVKHTNEYTKMLFTGCRSGEKFAECKRTLTEIQQAAKLKIEKGGYLSKKIFPDLPEHIINPPNPIDSKE